MTWASFGDFLHMGGYGAYVWGSYGLTLALLAVEAISVTSRERVTILRLQREFARGDSQ